MTHMVCVWFSQSSKTMIGSSKRDVFYFLLVTMTPPPQDMFPQGHREKVLGLFGIGRSLN